MITENKIQIIILSQTSLQISLLYFTKNIPLMLFPELILKYFLLDFVSIKGRIRPQCSMNQT